MTAPATVIDAHAHLWQREHTPQPWIDPVSMAVIDRDFWIDDLRERQVRAGIDGAVVVQSSNTTAETLSLLAASDGTSIRGVVGWLDLEADVPAQLARLREAPGGERLVGIRHLAHQDPDPLWLARETLDFAALAAAGLPFDIVIRPDQFAAAVAAVAAHPETTFVLDHLGKPPIASGELERWHADTRSLASFPNVVAKLSGLSTEAHWSRWTPDDLRPVVDTALDAFGPDRLLLGSDWPLVDLSGGLDRWLDAVGTLLDGLSASERDAVRGGNTITTYLGDTNA